MQERPNEYYSQNDKPDEPCRAPAVNLWPCPGRWAPLLMIGVSVIWAILILKCVPIRAVFHSLRLEPRLRLRRLRLLMIGIYRFTLLACSKCHIFLRRIAVLIIALIIALHHWLIIMRRWLILRCIWLC